MTEKQQQSALSSARLQHFNYFSSERRHDRRFSSSTAPPIMDYDPTEGLGGISVSSYDSIDDDRSPVEPAVRAYPYHDRPVNYPMPDQMLPYSAPPIYPSVPYQIDELGHAPGNYTPSDVSSISPPNGQVGNTKYSTVPPGDRIARALTIEEQNRLAAEEDKRRRNTAASARFRAKKKQREQQLERTVREATELNATLEARVAQLEMENRWLKNLLTEKNENLAARMGTTAPPLPQPPENSAMMASQGTNTTNTSGNEKPILPKRDVGVGTDS